MQQIKFDLPAMYGDHHVIEVRHLLSQLPGVDDIYASSGFQVVEVAYDEEQVAPDVIEETLAKAGYTGELPIPAEREEEEENGRGTFMRHTAAYAHTSQVVGFAQQVPYGGRPLWPCPGIGPMTPHTKTKEEVNGG